MLAHAVLAAHVGWVIRLVRSCGASSAGWNDTENDLPRLPRRASQVKAAFHLQLLELAGDSSRYNAATTIEAYSVRLRDQLDLDTLSTELLAVVDQTMEPTPVSLRLRPSAPGSSSTPPSEARPTTWAYKLVIPRFRPLPIRLLKRQDRQDMCW